MKKLGLLLVLLVTLGAAQSFALGIGVAYTPWFGLGDAATSSNGVALSLKLDQTDFIFGIGATIGTNTSIGITADVWLAKGNLIDFLNYYVGLGGYGLIQVNENNSAVDLGGRLPVGINAYLLDNIFELFLEIAPTLGVGFSDPIRFPTFNLQGAVGVRAWF